MGGRFEHIRSSRYPASPEAVTVNSHVKSMWSSPRHLRLAAVATLTAPLLAGCSSSAAHSPTDPPVRSRANAGTVVVGSNNFAESILLADIYGEALRARGFQVGYQQSLGSRETTYGLLRNGSLTVLPDYNGALLAYLDPKVTATTTDATDAAVSAELDPKLTALHSAAAQDKDSLTVTAATARKYNLTSHSSIGDLANSGSDLVIGGSPEFQTRQRGLVGLESVYHLTPKSFKALDAGGPLTEAALQNGNVQAADIFTTDPAISTEKYVVLRDPENLFGVENVLPLVYKPGLSQTGVDVLNAVSAKLDTAALLDLDAQAQSQNKDPLAVAQAWLTAVGLS
jgi:osmoprotectant transport system substrate-binding protein